MTFSANPGEQLEVVNDLVANGRYISKAALTGIRRITTWIARDRPVAAQSISAELRRTRRTLGDTLEAFPKVGGVRDGQVGRRVAARFSIDYSVV